MTEQPGDEVRSTSRAYARLAPNLVGTGSPEPRCASCGRPLAGTDHRRCELDPPRLCPHCGRRMRVQVLPLRYRATCPSCDAAATARPQEDGQSTRPA